jgi:hypothetical protein
MHSDRQLEANRLNARKSTGPRTLIGKARASMNALKHGLTGRDIVFPSEHRHEYDAFRAGLLVSLDPHGDLQGLLADKLVADAWRIRRIPILEAALHRRGRNDLAVEHALGVVQESRSVETSAMFSALTSRFAQPSPARAEAERKLQRARIKNHNLSKRDPLLDVTRVLETSVDAFANLWRHERALTRSLHRTLHELQRLQAVRAGEHVPAPAVIDVNLDATPAHAQGFQSDLERDLEGDIKGAFEGD